MINNIMNETTNIERVVMRRVYRISWLRIVISGSVFSLALALLTLYGLGREVWVARVFDNGPDDLIGQAFYLIYAFEHTRFVVQGLVVICIASFLFLARELARLLTNANVRELQSNLRA